MAINYISKITLPDNTQYEIKDAWARDQITAITGGSAVTFKGVSSTALTDGGNENPTVDGDVISTKTVGDLYFYQKEEFIYGDDGKWHSLGSQLQTLGDLAYKNNATASYTPAGTVTQPTFSGTASTLTSKGTPAGTVSQPTFSGTAVTIKTTGTPNGSVNISTATGTANYTPAGTVSTPTITVTPSTITVKTISDRGSLPSCTLPVFTANVTNENLALSWSSGSFNAGSLASTANSTVATGISSASASQPTFSGTGVNLAGSFTGSATTFQASYTPAGTVSQPTFSGAQLSSTVSYTPAGTVSQPTFNGTAATITAS